MFENSVINNLKFAPYEDFLGVGLENGNNDFCFLCTRNFLKFQVFQA